MTDDTDDLRRFEAGLRRRRRAALGVIIVLAGVAVAVVAYATRSVERARERNEWRPMEASDLSAEERAAIEALGATPEARAMYDQNPVLAVPDIECPPSMIAIPSSAEVRAFCIEGVDTTIGQFLDCVDAGKCPRFPVRADCPSMKDAPRDAPVICIDFEPADAYCRAIGRRSPSFDEWSRAVMLTRQDINLRCVL